MRYSQLRSKKAKVLNPMTIDLKREEKHLTIIPHGRLDSVSSDSFKACIDENFQAADELLTLDFSDVAFISSKGLRVMVSIYKNLTGRSMEILDANESVRDVFRLSGLLKSFNFVYSD